MTRPSSFFFGAAAASLGLHLFFFGLLTPRLDAPVYAPSEPQAVFLGAVLQRDDVSAFGTSRQGAGRAPDAVLRPQAGGPTAYRVKDPQAPLKPLPALTEALVEGVPPVLPAPSCGPGVPAGPSRISFYLFEPPAVLLNVDFSDLGKMVGREEVSAQMECELTLTADGKVAAVRRITGSGNPILDSFIVFKLQRAVFRTDDLNTAQPVRLLIRLK